MQENKCVKRFIQNIEMFVSYICLSYITDCRCKKFCLFPQLFVYSVPKRATNCKLFQQPKSLNKEGMLRRI